MAKYIIYRYQFSPIQSNVQSMFPVEVENMSDEDLMQNKQTLFASLFGENAEMNFNDHNRSHSEDGWG